MTDYYYISQFGNNQISLGLTSDNEIIDLAKNQCGRRVAGIPVFVESGEFMPKWGPVEEFEAAVLELNSNGNTYRIYDTETGADAFLAQADLQVLRLFLKLGMDIEDKKC